MAQMKKGLVPERLDPEKVAYWYFRLNGFFQIENFVVHPARRGSQRTDADLLAVRFPHRAERLFDDPNNIMADDEQSLALSREMIDVLLIEIKANQPCALNGPWTRQDDQNVHRVLAAIGCVPPQEIEQAAADIYRTGFHEGNSTPRHQHRTPAECEVLGIARRDEPRPPAPTAGPAARGGRPALPNPRLVQGRLRHRRFACSMNWPAPPWCGHEGPL